MVVIQFHTFDQSEPGHIIKLCVEFHPASCKLVANKVSQTTEFNSWHAMQTQTKVHNTVSPFFLTASTKLLNMQSAIAIHVYQSSMRENLYAFGNQSWARKANESQFPTDSWNVNAGIRAMNRHKTNNLCESCNNRWAATIINQ